MPGSLAAGNASREARPLAITCVSIAAPSGSSTLSAPSPLVGVSSTQAVPGVTACASVLRRKARRSSWRVAGNIGLPMKSPPSGVSARLAKTTAPFPTLVSVTAAEPSAYDRTTSSFLPGSTSF